MNIDKIVGNANFKKAITAALANDKLCHCILLCGGRGMGTGFVSLCLAADYLYPEGDNSQSVWNGNCTELLIIEGEGASKEIKIDTVRQMRKDIFSTALCGSRRCVIIKNAENFNSSSANALLKLLEEPPENVLFILTASSVSAVLATIRSRACAYTLSDVSVLECSAYLKARFANVSHEKLEELSKIFAGRIGLCIKAITDEFCADALMVAQNICEHIKNNDEYSLLAAFSQYEKDKPKAIQIIESLRFVLCYALNGNSQLLPHTASCVIPLLYEAQKLLKQNVNAKLVYTCLAADLAASNKI